MLDRFDWGEGVLGALRGGGGEGGGGGNNEGRKNRDGERDCSVHDFCNAFLFPFGMYERRNDRNAQMIQNWMID